MRIDRLCFGAAAAIGAQILWLGSAPYALAAPFATLWHFLAFAAITLLLWIATRGQHPLVVTGGVFVLGLIGPDPLAAAAGALLTGATLYVLQGRPVCAESSPR